MLSQKASPKSLCPHGVVCCAKVELFPLPHDFDGVPYTGLLTAGTTLEHCVLRLSTAMKPPSQEIKSAWARALLYATGEKLRNAKLFPAAALKVFRQDQPSGNLLLGGSKVGQREQDFFAHCLCTSMTEQMPRPVKPFVKKFWQYSDYPLSLGCSDFCNMTTEGERVDNDLLNFPFALILRPILKLHPKGTNTSSNPSTTTATAVPEDSFDGFVDKTLSVPVGTVLFDLFACPDPYAVMDPTKLQRIGRITTTSEMISSAPNDGLFFRHQKKEQDYALRPTWPRALTMKVAIDGGRTEGTVGKLAGWKLFEQLIDKGEYIDFEKER